ncbi:jg26550, partial [Pararge aegeria aegeria]
SSQYLFFSKILSKEKLDTVLCVCTKNEVKYISKIYTSPSSLKVSVLPLSRSAASFADITSSQKEAAEKGHQHSPLAGDKPGAGEQPMTSGLHEM